MKRQAVIPMVVSRQVRTRTMLVTPDQAARWIADDVNQQNRHMRPDRVRFFVDLIKSGRFQLTHQGIAFDVNGILVDGQHRLAAIVKAGMAVEMMVSEGVAPKTRYAIDSGIRRSPTDNMVIARGWTHRKAEIITPAIMSIHRYIDGSTVPLNQDELDERAGRFNSAIEWVAEVSAGMKKQRFLSAPVVGAFIYAYGSSPEAIKRAFSDLNTGAISDPKDPILLLRDVIMTTAITGELRRGDVFRKTLSALHARIHGDLLSRLYIADTRIDFFKKRNGDM